MDCFIAGSAATAAIAANALATGKATDSGQATHIAAATLMDRTAQAAVRHQAGGSSYIKVISFISKVRGFRMLKLHFYVFEAAHRKVLYHDRIKLKNYIIYMEPKFL